MIRTKIKYIALACLGVLIILIISINAQQTKLFDQSNTTVINGTYLDIEKIVPQNQSKGSIGDTSYNLYLDESKLPYEISGTASGCFMYRAFEKEISEGKPIKIYVSNNRLVYCVIANNKEYLSFSCAKRVANGEKIYVPIALGVIFLLGMGIVYLKRDMDN